MRKRWRVFAAATASLRHVFVVATPPIIDAVAT